MFLFYDIKFTKQNWRLPPVRGTVFTQNGAGHYTGAEFPDRMLSDSKTVTYRSDATVSQNSTRHHGGHQGESAAGLQEKITRTQRS